jgi:DNA-binding transcriptional MerR regulator
MTRAYTIRDLERETGVPRTTIHFYLRQGLLPRAQKTAASRSLYTDEHVDILKIIGALKEQGRTLADIEKSLAIRLDELNEASVDLAARERRRTHDRILAVAAREFAVNGYVNSHVTDIMRQAGITATVFYNHFPSKRRLLTECVTLLMDWSAAYADDKQGHAADAAEGLLWNVFGHLRAFELGSAALALVRLEGCSEAEDPSTSIASAMADALVAEVARIQEALDSGQGRTERPSRFPGELVALELFASYQPLAICPMYEKYGPEALLEAHLWLFLAAQAARNGEVDVDARLERYRPLIAALAATEPPLPPELEPVGEAPEAS